MNREQMSKLIHESLAMTDQLLALCDRPIDDHRQALNMTKDFPKLKALGHSNLLIPLQESLTASLPPSSAAGSVHQPFPADSPTFHGGLSFSFFCLIEADLNRVFRRYRCHALISKA